MLETEDVTDHLQGVMVMTPEEWKKEFRKELNGLREPIKRLCALITLYPSKYLPSCNRTIRNTFEAIAKQETNDPYYPVDITNLRGFIKCLHSYLNPTHTLNG